MLEAPGFLVLVAFAWLLYAGKVVQFVFRVLAARRDHSLPFAGQVDAVLGM